MGKNRLGEEQSPYLLQHKDNPIWWFPWGPDAFAQAAQENKPIFLSVGYATCHWCHVMEGDSFEDQAVADLLNEHFVCIKLDREERPDIDHIYMSALQAMTGQGGWPMSIALTPSLEPFWCATFVEKNQFIRVMERIAELWNSPKQPELIESAKKLVAHIDGAEAQSIAAQHQPEKALDQFYFATHSRFDDENGGFTTAPKFPPSMTLLGLIRYANRKGQGSDMIRKTLHHMILGGLFDQVGGGIHRYATDESWLIPHFEKMLYDNALFVWTLAEAHSLLKEPQLLEALDHTIAYLQRDMLSGDGAFYSAEDADSEKTEGKFYLWTYDELKKLLSEKEFAYLSSNFDLSIEGNFVVDKRVSQLEQNAGLQEFEHGIILEWVEKNLAEIDYKAFAGIREKLLSERAKRVRPLRDDKILTSWNGLMIGALARAACLLDNASYRSLAEGAAEALVSKVYAESDGTLAHRYREKQAGIGGLFEDYSYFIFGLIELYQTSANEKWLTLATELTNTAIRDFYDEDSGMFFDSANDDAIIRTKTIQDNATPAAASMMCFNLLRLGAITEDLELTRKGDKLLATLQGLFDRYPMACPFLTLSLELKLAEAPVLKAPAGVNSHHSMVEQTGIWPSACVKYQEGDQYQICFTGRCLEVSPSFEGAVKGIES